ncbi:hypothetical protein FHP05_06545 [Cerasibacillus terrae]|uniref:Uncharacterized protein n=1 Tax=Cerasibacillus terrae TaxID=2498845 RepID=A0A5C8NX59_9BACI|nr:hypothetical protein [Cerasibacillus terrae]TXL65775.1 hypothetical protein FHP05_06545 [Cerasibacillus terrae]
MANNRGMMTTLMAVGAAGAAIYGIRRGMQNGTFQQMGKSLQNMTNNQGVQEVTSALASTMNQDSTGDASQSSAQTMAQNLE